MTSELGRLVRVPLRQAWPREDSMFTPWLAQADNLCLLGHAIDIDLEFEGVEQAVGPFRADILCRTRGSDRLVLIENQLERTDHGHLGQLITYAAGLQTATIVWIAATFTAEHRAAFDWLNAATSEDFCFFGVEVELWRIDESRCAPRFEVVCRPNSWSRAISQAVHAAQRGELSELGARRLAYWSGFRRFLDERGGTLRLDRDHAAGNISFPVSGSSFVIVAYRSKDGPGVFVRVREADAADYAFRLSPFRHEFSELAGARFMDFEEDEVGRSWLGANLDNPDDANHHSEQYGWLAETIERFQHAMRRASERLRESGAAAA